MISIFLPSDLSLDRRNDLLGNLIVALCLVYLMNRLHGLTGLATRNVEGWSIELDHNQEAKQSQAVEH